MAINPTVGTRTSLTSSSLSTLASVITLTEKMALLALTVEPDPVSAQDVANALEGK